MKTYLKSLPNFKWSFLFQEHATGAYKPFLRYLVQNEYKKLMLNKNSMVKIRIKFRLKGTGRASVYLSWKWLLSLQWLNSIAWKLGWNCQEAQNPYMELLKLSYLITYLSNVHLIEYISTSPISSSTKYFIPERNSVEVKNWKECSNCILSRMLKTLTH